jgi:hypothetical protein
MFFLASKISKRLKLAEMAWFGGIRKTKAGFVNGNNAVLYFKLGDHPFCHTPALICF